MAETASLYRVGCTDLKSIYFEQCGVRKGEPVSHASPQSAGRMEAVHVAKSDNLLLDQSM